MNLNEVFRIFRSKGIGLQDDSLRLCDWKESWSVLANSEIGRLSGALGNENAKIYHVGSTAVVGLSAKPIIDLVGEVPNFYFLEEKALELEECGYISMGEYGIEGRRYLILKDHKSVTYVHLHVFLKGDDRVGKHIAFRNYLSSNPHALARYENFKKSLLVDGKLLRKFYSKEKEPIMKALTKEADDWMQGRRDFKDVEVD